MLARMMNRQKRKLIPSNNLLQSKVQKISFTLDHFQKFQHKYLENFCIFLWVPFILQVSFLLFRQKRKVLLTRTTYPFVLETVASA